LAREASRDSRRRAERLAAATRRWEALLSAERRRARERAQALPGLEIRLRRAFADSLRRRRDRVASATQLLGAVSYRSVLARGFALVKDEKGRPLHRAADVLPPQSLKIQFADGEIDATAGGPGAPRKPAKAKKPADAPTLF